ncbi:Protein Jade-3, partial [Stegodyphus mimosarum]
MKLPDNEPLTPDDYWLIEDSWKPEWERGVQVPVYPEALPEPHIRVLRKRNKEANFKL